MKICGFEVRTTTLGIGCPEGWLTFLSRSIAKVLNAMDSVPEVALDRRYSQPFSFAEVN